MRRRHRDQVEQQSRALDAGQVRRPWFLACRREPELRERERRGGGVAIVGRSSRGCVQRESDRVERFHDAGETSDRCGVGYLARLQGERAGHHLGEVDWPAPFHARRPSIVTSSRRLRCEDPERRCTDHAASRCQQGGARARAGEGGGKAPPAPDHRPASDSSLARRLTRDWACAALRAFGLEPIDEACR